MSSEHKPAAPPAMDQIDLNELARILIRHQGIKSGLYTLSLRFHFGFGPVGPKDSRFPGGFMGVDAVGLVAVEEPGPLVVDAAEVWADKKPLKRKTPRGTDLPQ